MNECKTICIHCKWHAQEGGQTIHSHLCTHPGVAKPREQCPVTGRVGYAEVNSLGGVFLAESPHPMCRTLNHGNCELYEERK